MPTIHVEKSDTAEDIARKIHATNPSKPARFTEILDAIRGYSFGPGEVQELRAAIDCRVGRVAPPKSTGTAECALAAVYEAIEQQAGHQDANLAGLAALVTALKPRALFAYAPTLNTNVPDDARLGMVPPKDL